MKAPFSAYKGISPAKYLQRQLANKKMSQRMFAQKAGEHYQVVNAIVNGHRKLTVRQALTFERVLNLEEGFLLMLQTSYDIELYKQSEAEKCASVTKHNPNVRSILFWDVDFKSLDWIRYKDFVIRRIMERGSAEEINEINRYYGNTSES